MDHRGNTKGAPLGCRERERERERETERETERGRERGRERERETGRERERTERSRELQWSKAGAYSGPGHGAAGSRQTPDSSHGGSRPSRGESGPSRGL